MTAWPGSTAPRSSRAAATGALVALALLAGLLASASHSAAQTRLTRGPYLQNATPTEITVLWQTDRPTAPVVEYGAQSEGASGTVWRAVGSGERGQSHAITLTGLTPGTRYHYRVRADGDVVYDGGTFRTLSPPDAENLDFVVYGDNRTNHSPHADVVRRILAEQPLPEVLIHTGDLVESGMNAEQWDVFFRLERELLAQVPLFPALGNHEDNSPLYWEYLRFPSNGTREGHGRWYSFDAGPAHFVALDVVFSDIGPGSPQYRWLARDLAETDRPWKFVYFHYPPYNASEPHGSNLRLRETLEPLFLRHGVSAVLTGHAHIYERAFGGGDPPLLYLISGGGGAPQHKVGLQPWTRYTEASYHFVRVNLRGDRITTVGVRADGTEFDRFEGVLSSDGRVVLAGPPITPVAVAGPGAAQFLGSFQGLLVLGYTFLFAVVLPLAVTTILPARRKPVIPVPAGALRGPRMPLADPHTDWRGLPVLRIAGTIAALLLLAMLVDAPLQWLIGFDFYTVTLTIHGVSGLSVVIAAALAGTLGYRLAARRPPSRTWLAANTAIVAGLTALSVLLGNVLYAGYVRSDGPMETLIRKAPEAHRVLFEFKEYVGLVPLPLAVAAAFVAWRYRPDLRRDRYLAESLALVLLLLALYCILPLVLGVAVTRLRGIV